MAKSIENSIDFAAKRPVWQLIALPWPHRIVLMTPPTAFPEENSGVIAEHLSQALR